MHIKKLKHCCLVIDIPVKGSKKAVRVLTDPGSYSIEEHDKVKGVDIVLITHEHQDHFHIESLKALVKRQPDVAVIANDTVGEMLAKEGIKHRIMLDGNSIERKGVKIEAYGKLHAILHKSIPQSSNVGFFMENKLFMPGDAYTDPKQPSMSWPSLPADLDEDVRSHRLRSRPEAADVISGPRRHEQRFHERFHRQDLGQNGIEFVKLENGAELDVK